MVQIVRNTERAHFALGSTVACRFDDRPPPPLLLLLSSVVDCDDCRAGRCLITGSLRAVSRLSFRTSIAFPRVSPSKAATGEAFPRTLHIATIAIIATIRKSLLTNQDRRIITLLPGYAFFEPYPFNFPTLCSCVEK